MRWLVDKAEWFEAWEKDIYADIPDNAPQNRDTVLLIDYSTTTDTPDSDKNNIKTALYNYIEAAYSNERIAILIDDIPVNTLCGFTSAESKEELFSAMNSDISAGSSSYDISIAAAVEMFSKFSATPYRSIILLTNSQCRISEGTLQNAKNANVKITTIGFGKHVDEDGLLKIADSTGGEFYLATSTAELGQIYKDIGENNDPDMTDTDGDGLPDIIETVGIRISTGEVIHDCDPDKPDTDGDGLEDGEEIDPTIRYTSKYYQPLGSQEIIEIRSYFFERISDPTLPDSDWDEYDDYDEVKIHHSDPLVSDVTEVVSLLRTEYINILKDDGNFSYGGDQGWFSGKMKELGCGLISSCDILIYLGINHFDKYYFAPRIMYNQDGSIKYSTYFDFVMYYYDNYLFITDDYDTWGTNIASVLKEYMADYGVNADVYWANLNDVWSYTELVIAYLCKNYNVRLRSYEEMFDNITAMLSEDIPVMLALGPYTTENISFYDSIDKIIHSGNSSKSTREHYVTVTAIYYDDIARDYYFQISSWGERYYMSYNEYTSKRDIFSGETNIKL